MDAHESLTELSIASGDHQGYMEYALALAKKAPPMPTNFCVGAILVDQVTNHVLATGYTMELPGNMHAEQCCLRKVEGRSMTNDMQPEQWVLYTTMEPCNARASGNKPCTETILDTSKRGVGAIRTVYVGVQEPEKFVGENTGRARLEEAGIQYIHVAGLEEEILAVATAGHTTTT